MADIVERLRGFADLFEAQHAPGNLVLHMRAGADEIERLRASGCARDQGMTQYCAEAAMKDAEIASLLNTLADERTESMRLRAALKECLGWHDYADDMYKPIEVRAAYMRARAALTAQPAAPGGDA